MTNAAPHTTLPNTLTSNDIDTVAISYQLPRLIKILYHKLPKSIYMVDEKNELYPYILSLITNQIRQQETLQIRSGARPELANKENRHQVTALTDGFSIVNNQATVKLALADYNLLTNPNAIVTEGVDNFVFTHGIYKLNNKPPGYLKTLSTKRPPVFKTSAEEKKMKAFLQNNQQAAVAAALCSSSATGCRNLLNEWLENAYTNTQRVTLSETNNIIQSVLYNGLLKNKNQKNTLD